MPVDWTPEEIAVTIEAYFWMLDQQQAGRPFVKAEVRRQLQPRLHRRSAPAIEYKFQNISAILDSYGLDYVTGYLPARNVQRALRVRVAEVIAGRLRSQGQLARPRGNPIPPRVLRQQVAFDRDPFVREWVLQVAAGRCELCGKPAPFKLPTGEPYLEVHHVVPLADNGHDTPENTVALCPNCHRRVHLGADAARQREALYRKIGRLEKPVH